MSKWGIDECDSCAAMIEGGGCIGLPVMHESDMHNCPCLSCIIKPICTKVCITYKLHRASINLKIKVGG